MNSEPRPIERFPAFDWVRLFLAGFVAVLHTLNNFYGRSHTGPHYVGMTIAVPGFLAVSGFCVLQSYERSQGWLHFAWKRVCRIMPALGFSFLLVGLIWGLEPILPTEIKQEQIEHEDEH